MCAQSLPFSHTDLVPITTLPTTTAPALNAPIAAVRSLNNTIQPTLIPLGRPVSGNNLPDERVSAAGLRRERHCEVGQNEGGWLGGSGGVERLQPVNPSVGSVGRFLHASADFGIVSRCDVRQQSTGSDLSSPPPKGSEGCGGGFCETSNKPFVRSAAGSIQSPTRVAGGEWRGTITPPRKEAASENRGHLGNTTRTDRRRSQNEEQMHSRMMLSFPSNFLKLVIFTLITSFFSPWFVRFVFFFFKP